MNSGQKNMRNSKIAMLGKTYSRTVSPTHMTILTDRELITIREEHRWGREDRYGGIWDYIPLNKIVALSPSSKGSNLPGLSIQLPGSTCLDYLFQASAEQGLDRLLIHFNELTA